MTEQELKEEKEGLTHLINLDIDKLKMLFTAESLEDINEVYSNLLVHFKSMEEYNKHKDDWIRFFRNRIAINMDKLDKLNNNE